MSLKAKIEAVLFLTAKPVKAQAMARIVNADVQDVRQALLELVHDYEERQGGLEIADEDGYSFQVKDEYASLMDEFLPVEMSAALIRTLSAIAIKQPISQAEIIRVRGAGAYEHIRELANRDLIAKKEEQGGGRSPILSTTKKFQEYFRLSKDGKNLRNFLKGQVKKMVAAEDALAAGQLSIGDVVTPEMDVQLNNRIFLETADMSAAAAEDMDSPIVAEGDGSEYTEGAAVLLTETAGVGTPVMEAADLEAPVVETASLETPMLETADLEAQISRTSLQAETIDVTPPPPPPPYVEMEDDADSASNTLSKLAEAAVVNDPEPLPQVERDGIVVTFEQEAETETEETAAPPSISASSKSTIQAQTAKNGPPTGKKKRSSGLSDLLKKQRDLERALKQARGDSVEQAAIDFNPQSDKASPADKNLPS